MKFLYLIFMLKDVSFLILQLDNKLVFRDIKTLLNMISVSAVIRYFLQQNANEKHEFYIFFC